MAQEEINISETIGERLKGWGTKIVSSKLWTPFAGVADTAKLVDATIDKNAIIVKPNQIEFKALAGEADELRFLINLYDSGSKIELAPMKSGVSGEKLTWDEDNGWTIGGIPIVNGYDYVEVWSGDSKEVTNDWGTGRYIVQGAGRVWFNIEIGTLKEDTYGSSRVTNYTSKAITGMTTCCHFTYETKRFTFQNRGKGSSSSILKILKYKLK